MILVDTSIWIDHLRANDEALVHWLNLGQVLTHPCVVGEIALGNLKKRESVLGALSELPSVSVATDQEVISFIENNQLFGQGIGYVDAHLLAAVRLTPGVALWTRDKRLRVVGDKLGLTLLER